MSRMRNEKGLTLVEIIVSTLLISIIAAGSFAAFVGTRQLFNYTRHRLQAFNFAKETYDRLRSNYGYTDSQVNEGAHSDPESEIGTVIRGEMSDLYTDFTYSVTEEPTGGYKEVEITITWSERAF